MARVHAWLFLVLLAGCARSHDVREGFDYSGHRLVEIDEPDPEADSERTSSSDKSSACAKQIKDAMDGVPKDLECTGLFADMNKRTVAEGIDSFEPGYALWSDDAGKSRWIKLPDGEKIDSSDPKRWRFPLHTKFWKEFRANGAPVETRYYEKVREDRWVKTTYLWNDKGTSAQRHDTGMELSRNGMDYVVPDSGKCDDCHEGSKENVMGFEPVSLGLPSADTGGLTLRKLVERDLLTDPPERTEYTIGDDGTGKAADALGWLHINCGVACHNDGVNSKAEVTGLRMKLDPTLLDGRPSNDFDAIKLLVNREAQTAQWAGQTRIVPGNPDESLLYHLVTTRVEGGGNRQMPPLASRVVDDENTDKIREWILAMNPAEPPK
jgi:hypothetical protein